MPLLITKPHLSCFYCGARTQYLKDGKTRVFDCKNCEATNFLDQNGEITDIPATPTVAQPAVFAHSRRPSQSTTDNLKEKSLFCQTCLRNQHFLVSCLADYLPSEDDPDYAKYEAQYPEYLKDIRRRYPQVCAQCAPKAQSRIRKTGYAAKVDFLTRSLEQSKATYYTNHAPWNNLKISALQITSWAWWLSVMVQLCWHALCVLGSHDAGTDAGRPRPPNWTVWCAVGLFSTTGCHQLAANLVSRSLLASLCIIWWNPTLRDRYIFPRKLYQPTNLKDFYWFQALILMSRYAIWLGLVSDSETDATTMRALHFVALLFIAFSTLGLQRMIRYTSVPKVSFKDKTGSLVEEGDFQYPTDDFISKASTQPPGSYLITKPKISERKPFSIFSLGPQGQRTSPGKTDPLTHPTPEPQEDAADSMDWEPVIQPPPHRHPSLNHQIQPPTPVIPSFLRPTAPPTVTPLIHSPFTGRLPAAPRPPAHRILNPPVPPQFHPTPVSKQTDFFSRMGLSTSTLPTPSSSTKLSRFRTGAESDKENQTYIARNTASTGQDQDPFRPAQWTLKSDLDAARKGTGLEDMFTRSFSIAENNKLKDKKGEEEEEDRPGHHRRKDVDSGSGMFEVGRRAGRTESAEEIVGRSFNVFVLPGLFALLAVVVAVVREPVWVARMWEGAVGKIWLERRGEAW